LENIPYLGFVNILTNSNFRLEFVPVSNIEIMSNKKRDLEEESRLRGYLKTYEKQESGAREILAKLTGVQEACVDRWFDDNEKTRRTPMGWNRIMILFHLQCAGMPILEVEMLPETLQKYGKLLSKHDACRALEHAERTLCINPARVSKIFRGVALLTKKQERTLRGLFSGESSGHPAPQHTPVKETPINAPDSTESRKTHEPLGEVGKRAIVSAFVASLESTARLAEILTSGHFTDEEREAVREETKHSGRVSLFRTVDLLRALLSPESLKRFNADNHTTQ
jgi:hypothetical protein